MNCRGRVIPFPSDISRFSRDTIKNSGVVDLGNVALHEAHIGKTRIGDPSTSTGDGARVALYSHDLSTSPNGPTKLAANIATSPIPEPTSRTR
jgi:hypothetical protein